MLPVNFPAAVFVVQHIGRNDSILPAVLSQAGPLPAAHPAHGQGIVPGHIYVAPPDHHMRLTLLLIHLDTGPKIHFTLPAADPLFNQPPLPMAHASWASFQAMAMGTGLRGCGISKRDAAYRLFKSLTKPRSRHAAASYNGG
jgi:chemotaxis response regulator CheB